MLILPKPLFSPPCAPIRTINFRTVKIFDGVTADLESLPPLPRGSYQTVIEAPIARLPSDGPHALTIEPSLTDALLADLELEAAATCFRCSRLHWERLYLEYRGRGRLERSDYVALGGMKGAIEAAVERAFVAQTDPKIPADRLARLTCYGAGSSRGSAGIDLESGSPRRRVARIAEIPSERGP